MSKQMETGKRKIIDFQDVLIINAVLFYFKRSSFAFNKMLGKYYLWFKYTF